MTTVIADEEEGFKLYSKGASEVLLELCTSVVSTTGEPKEFTKEDAGNLFRDFIDPWQKEGLRILCLTTKNISSSGCFLDCSQSSIFPYDHQDQALCVTGCHLA